MVVVKSIAVGAFVFLELVDRLCPYTTQALPIPTCTRCYNLNKTIFMSQSFHSNQSRALLFGLVAVLCWSTVASAFKLSLNYLSPIQLILVATATSLIFLLIILVWQGRLNQLSVLTRSQWLWSALFGLMNPALYYWLLFSAYDALPAQEAQAINYSWAIVMSLLAVPMLGQKLSRYDVVAVVLCYFGVLVIATKGQPFSLQFDNLVGVLLALASTLVWSLYWILNRRDTRDPILGLCLNFIFALPIILLLAWLSGDLHALADVQYAGLWGGIYVGVFEMGLAFVLWLKAMKLASNTSQLANLIFISPFLSLIFIAVLLKEVILVSTVFGLVLIIVGLVIQQRLALRSA